MNYVIASDRPWNRDIVNSMKVRSDAMFVSVTHKVDLPHVCHTYNPRYVFFPHWSHIIPGDIYANYECIIFHMTDVPYGRGGSPLQNLIAMGHKETKITALRCEKELDAGPIYAKRPLLLGGTAEEIYLKASDIIAEMIDDIIDNKVVPVLQSGEIVPFKRRQPSDSNLLLVDSLDSAFDCIRMVDAEGYPKAFIEAGGFRFEFSRASRKCDKVIADVTITKKQ